MRQFPNRKSIRFKGFDYKSPGYYFITICTYQKRHILESIISRSSVLSGSGQILVQCWNSLPNFFSAISTDASIVMPNHFHGIIRLLERNEDTLGLIVRNFKSISARRIRAANKTDSHIWQRNYYERVIRTERELNLIRLYIDLNPLMWQENQQLSQINFKSEEELAALLEKYRSTL